MNVKMTLEDFKKEFKIFCIDPHNPDSKKPGSYARAIEYLCVFLKKEYVDSETITLIKDKEDDIKNKQSDFYSQLKAFLKNRSQRDGKTQESYLENGFIRAAIPYLFEYWETKMISENDDDTKDYSDRNGNAEILPCQKIFFGAPGTGKSYKVNSILPNEDIWSVSDEIRKQLFLDSDTAKKAHYAEVLDNKEKFGDIWNVGELSVLEEKLSEVNSVDNVSNPEYSALQAYIKFLKEYKFEHVFRTTFHPDYDYAQFVGAYKPKKEGEKITYSFVPQVFAKAYAAAWKLYLQRDSRLRGNDNENGEDDSEESDIRVSLVIEEINRGNCAQIFGDIFQLLDRVSDSPDKGFSQYSIDADCDFAEWLKTNDNGLKSVWPAYEEKVGDGKLKLPPNLNILATMNTSDQSLFPMDSAFKRRFDWEYVPIKYAKDSDCGDDWKADEFKIVIGDSKYMWLDFLKKVNADIYDATQSEDKQMGEFFIKPKSDDLKIAFNEFRSKVLFYLWDSVYKDETERQAVFHFPYGDGDGKINSVTFQSLFGKDAEATVNKIMENLKVEKVTA